MEVARIDEEPEALGRTRLRRLADRLRVVTGLPRPDRWQEVRPGALAAVDDVAGMLFLQTAPGTLVGYRL